MEAAIPVLHDHIHENETNVHSGVPANASKLSVVKEAVFLRLKLQPFGDDFGEKLANCVQEGNGPECLWNVIHWFLGLGDDAQDSIF